MVSPNSVQVLTSTVPTVSAVHAGEGDLRHTSGESLARRASDNVFGSITTRCVKVVNGNTSYQMLKEERHIWRSTALMRSLR